MKLPNAELAEIYPEKLREYLLSPSHPVGRFKARYFQSLDYTADDWEALRDGLLNLAREGEAEELPSPYGKKFRVVGTLSAGSATDARIATIWMLSSSSPVPRFVTAYPE